MTGGSPLEGSRSTARIATRRPPTWILREPRIGPVVTFNSVRAGASPIFSLPPPVLAGSGSAGRGRLPPLSSQELPGEESSVEKSPAAGQRRRLLFASAARRASPRAPAG